jgi:hypothetical protein
MIDGCRGSDGQSCGASWLLSRVWSAATAVAAWCTGKQEAGGEKSKSGLNKTVM